MTLKENYDAIVIGAGPAGSTFARVAAEGGMDVLVIEKRKEIGAPVRCGEGLSQNYDGVKVPLKLPPGALNNSTPIIGAALYGPNRQKIVVKNEHTHGWVLDRKVFDKALAIEAGRKGATVVTKTRVTSLIKDGAKIVGVKAIHMDEEREFRAPLIVSAEGMENLMAREAGFKAVATLYDTDTCVQYEMTGVECEGLIEIYFGSVAPRGYVWIFPKGSDTANVGIGVGGLSGPNGYPDPKGLLDKFISSDSRFAKASTVAVQGGGICVGAPINEFVKDNFMVIGTAAHQVDPIHGGGIGLAIEAGYYAAKVALKAHAKKDYSKAALTEYETTWREKSWPSLEKRLKLRHAIEKLNDDDLNAVFDTIKEEDVGELLQGKFVGTVGKVLARRPQLLKTLTALVA